MLNYDQNLLNELIEYQKKNGFYRKKGNLVYDIRIINLCLSYINNLLTETERCNVQLRYNTAEDYYYQMSCHCYCCGLILSNYFSENELNEKSLKEALDLVNLTDTIVTADRVAKINNVDLLDEQQNLLFDVSLICLEDKWDKTFDNKNINVITMLLSSCLAGCDEEYEMYQTNDDSEQIYWRDEEGKIRCLGDECEYEKCPDDCPIYMNTIALELMNRKQFEQAIVILQKATVIASDFKDLWNNIGACWGFLKQYKYAHDAYKTAYDIDNKYNKAIYGLALTAKDLGNKDESLEWCKLYEQLFNDDRCKEIKKHFEDKTNSIKSSGLCATVLLRNEEEKEDNNLADKLAVAISLGDKQSFINEISKFINLYHDDERVLRIYKRIEKTLEDAKWYDLQLRTLDYIIKQGNGNRYSTEAKQIKLSKFKKPLFGSEWIRK